MQVFAGQAALLGVSPPHFLPLNPYPPPPYVDRWQRLRQAAFMSTILEADVMGALHLPASLLPHPAPGRHYYVVTDGRQVVVEEAARKPAEPNDRESWLLELESRRVRGFTGKSSTPLQQIFDELRG